MSLLMHLVAWTIINRAKTGTRCYGNVESFIIKLMQDDNEYILKKRGVLPYAARRVAL